VFEYFIGGREMLYEDITSEIIKIFYKVNNTLGYGFLEKVYENAIIIELKKAGIKIKQQENIKVFYEGEEVGNYYADIIVEDKIILELKCCENLRDEHRNQLINYLKATNMEVGLLLNFGKNSEFKRVIFSKKDIKEE
jgi:GxxExxY protein